MNARQLLPHVSAHHFFGAELRYWREQRGLSQAELAAAVHVSQDLIRKVEHAERWPTAPLALACDGRLQSHGILVRLQRLVESERVGARRAQPRIDHETIAQIVYQVLKATDPDGVDDMEPPRRNAPWRMRDASGSVTGVAALRTVSRS